MSQLRPEDLLKFGLIPEFVGRLPVMITLQQLDEQALVNILTEPKNALVKQYRRLLEMDGVELEFTEEALKVIANLAIQRKSGARGLRAIIEDIMMDTMYELPSQGAVTRCIITEKAARGECKPELICGERQVSIAPEELPPIQEPSVS